MDKCMLKNKIVLITGASSGIGAACARQFSKLGAKLLLCARRLDKLDELVNELRSTKGAVYCATKYAVNAITNGLRMDLFGKKIRVSTIDPGAVETNFSLVRFKGDLERAKSVYKGMDPLSPDDVADAVLYCATRPSHV